jgi:hypothetical protein
MRQLSVPSNSSEGSKERKSSVKRNNFVEEETKSEEMNNAYDSDENLDG